MLCLCFGSLFASIYSVFKAPKLYIEAINEEITNPFIKWILIIAVILAVGTMPFWGGYLIYFLISLIGG